MQLFDGQDADGDSEIVGWGPGRGVVQVDGTFDGCTVTLHLSLDQGATYTATDASWTASGVKTIDIPAPCKWKLVLSGFGASTDVDAFLTREG